MGFIASRRTFSISVFTAVSLFAQPVIAQSNQEADGARLLRAPSACTFTWMLPLQGVRRTRRYREIRVAQSRGLRW
jgi:hypothetical protein